MPQRRYSRGNPYLLPVSEQREWLEILQQDPELQAALEAALGVPLAGLTGQEKLNALSRHLKSGAAAQGFNAATRALREMKAIGGQIRGDEEIAGQLDNAQKRNDQLLLEVEQLREDIARLRETAREGASS